MFIELDKDTVNYWAGGKATSFMESGNLRDACQAALSSDQKWWREKIAFVDGKIIQYRWRVDSGWSEWKDYISGKCPTFVTGEYRIKPEPKPDAVSFFAISQIGTWNEYASHIKPLIKIIRDGETGSLKSCEVI